MGMLIWLVTLWGWGTLLVVLAAMLTDRGMLEDRERWERETLPRGADQ